MRRILKHQLKKLNKGRRRIKLIKKLMITLPQMKVYQQHPKKLKQKSE